MASVIVEAKDKDSAVDFVLKSVDLETHIYDTALVTAVLAEPSDEASYTAS